MSQVCFAFSSFSTPPPIFTVTRSLVCNFVGKKNSNMLKTNSLRIARTPLKTLFPSIVRFVHNTNGLLDYDILEPKQKSHIPPAIFLHGLLGNRRNNKSACRMLAERLQTPFILPDLRNHGTSFHAEPFTYKTMTDDLNFLIDNLPESIPKDEGFIILGHSMGAKVAMIHALRHPDQVKGVVSVDNIPYVNPDRSLDTFEKFHISIRFILNCIKKHPEWTLSDLKKHMMKWVEPSELITDYWLANITRRGGVLTPKVPLEMINNSIEEVLDWKLEDYGDLEEYAHQKNMPPLTIIRANYSKIVGTDIHKHAIQKYFPDYEIAPIDCGHWVVTEKRHEFVKIVEDWAFRRFGPV